ncbi:hypothetical protein J2046_002925 [Rhizobium petrolearium]|nr:hypothetical protein [Neorhizobium petrolearium]
MAWIIGAVAVITTFWFSRKAGAVVLGILAAIYVGLFFTAERGDHQVQSNRPVSIVAGPDPQRCPDPSTPVAVTFTNTTDRTLQEISFSLIARQSGHSSTIYRAYHRSDKIVAPGESFSTCYGLNPLSFSNRTIQYNARELDWFAEISLTRFVSQ